MDIASDFSPPDHVPLPISEHASLCLITPEQSPDPDNLGSSSGHQSTVGNSSGHQIFHSTKVMSNSSDLVMAKENRTNKGRRSRDKFG